ncbi:sulfotransferase family protein [Rhodobacter sp. JA431]|uniref:sulfotransferase family 2 domain-containing protein n=1 Tax=Rhodobacter sp. JA431 TaxID=570013 RepID=UPI000BC517A7|nr:sulfotransferase family 2 domain-containing protein [Rhodobacter sp. JA431]SOB91563.1 sulfotransferase family protein [Rhodobacter sp. JA431]
MPIFRLAQKNVLFLHIPKAGGTSIESFLSTQSGESLRMKQNHLHLPCVPQHFHGELIETLFSADFFDYSFCVTRNPYARLLSEYNYRMGHRHFPWRHLPEPGFARWVRWVFTQYRRNPYVYSNHIRPQSAFSIAGTEAFRLEDQQEELMERLSALAGVEAAALPRTNMSKQRATAMDPQTAKLIYDFYREDFERFGYAEDSFQPQEDA